MLRSSCDQVAAAGFQSELSFTSFRRGGFTEDADSDLTDAELRVAGRHQSVRQLADLRKAYAKAAHLGDAEASRGANKSSRFVAIAADRLLEWQVRTTLEVEFASQSADREGWVRSEVEWIGLLKKIKRAQSC